jgi:protein-disulfide isomerase
MATKSEVKTSAVSVKPLQEQVQSQGEKLIPTLTLVVLLLQVVLSGVIILRLNALNRTLATDPDAISPPPLDDMLVQDVPIDDDPLLGPSDAPITVIEFADFQCAACQRADQILKQVIEKYPDKIRLIYRDFPLSGSSLAAQAAQCAHDQDKFWEMHDLLFANQHALAADNLKDYAARLGLDVQQFNACLESARYAEEIRKDIADGQRYGVVSVPTFFVNGRQFRGALPMIEWQQIVDQLLEAH